MKFIQDCNTHFIIVPETSSSLKLLIELTICKSSVFLFVYVH